MWLDKLIERGADIIRAAAASPLALVALAVIVFSVLAFFWFRHSSEAIRIGIFILLFIGVFLFAFSTGRESAVQQVTSSSQGGNPSNNEPISRPRSPSVDDPASNSPSQTSERSDSKDYFENGLRALIIGGYPQAASEFSDSARKAPSYADAHFFLGYSLYQQRKCREALESLNRAVVENNVYTVDTNFEYSSPPMGTGFRYPGSINLIRTLAYYFRGGIKYSDGDEQGANDDLRQATRYYNQLDQFEQRFLGYFDITGFSSSSLGSAFWSVSLGCQ